jgi:hypothetical protein
MNYKHYKMFKNEKQIPQKPEVRIGASKKE